MSLQVKGQAEYDIPARPTLDEFVESQREAEHIPGLAACIVVEDETAWSGVFGVASLETNVPVKLHTRFSVASISKVVAALSVVFLNEDGRLDLDRDINAYITVKVRNPHTPTIPITARQLLMHKSSLQDNEEGLHLWQVQGDSGVPLEEQIRRHLSMEGELFNPGDWSESPPGEAAYHYSNAGFTLLGYLVEQVAGQPFDAFTRNRIFGPLRMDTAAWHMAAIPNHERQDVANVYRYEAATAGHTAYGHYGVPQWPAAQLRVSVADLATLLREFTKRSMKLPTVTTPDDGEGKFTPRRSGERAQSANTNAASDEDEGGVLSTTAYRLMCPDTYTQGLGWWGQDAWYGYKGEEVWLHGGFMDGVRTQVNFYPKWSAGFVLLCNAEGDYKAIEARLKAEMVALVRSKRKIIDSNHLNVDDILVV